MYTSLELSKKLKENGCELESEKYYYKGKACNVSYHDEALGKLSKFYKAYDILWEICVEYAIEFWGKKIKYYNNIDWEYSYKYYPKKILFLLQTNKPQEEIEEYIWENCVFNPKNKEKK